jgi:hypothetical protein
MNGQASPDLQEQVDLLKREVWRLRVGTAFAVGAAVIAAINGAAGAAISATSGAQDSKALRVRSLVIEDEAGNDRIVLGAPVPDPREGRRNSPSTGMVINDEKGVERFAVGLQANGRVVMGFDAPPGTGDPRNRERITLVADATGGAYLRFLNRKTHVPGRLVLDDNDQFYLEFLDFAGAKVTTRRIGFKGEEIR